MYGDYMHKFIFLSNEFYKKYDIEKYKEIEHKPDRPYIQVCVLIDGVQYAIPLRSHIKHKHVLWTDKEHGCGLDFSKAVVIEDERDIDNLRKPHIRDNEFAALRGKEFIVETKMRKYSEKYKKAKLDLSKDRNKNLCQYSTLQYFERYL